MKKKDMVKRTAMIVEGVIAVVAMLTDSANAILAIGLFAMVAFVLCV